MKVIVTGGRFYKDEKTVERALGSLRITFLIEGGAKGADRLARQWAIKNFIPYKTYDADWDQYGLAAGPIRSAQMLDEHPSAIVMAFPGDKGTAGCVTQAKARGMLVLSVSPTES